MTTQAPSRTGAKAGSPLSSRLLSEAPEGPSPPSSSYVQEGVLHECLPPTGDVRLVGYGRLRLLLAPAHSYFRDKAGFIESWSVSRDTGNEKRLAYPTVRPVVPGSRENPYRRHKSRQKAAARSFKRLERLRASYGLSSLPVLDFTPTVPKSLSRWIAGQGKKGREIAWKLFKRYWAEDVEPLLLGKDKGYLAARVNLHTWSSENPLEPHTHFHCLIPLLARYRPGLDVGPAPDLRYLSWVQEEILDEDGRQKKVTVPVGKDVLERLKARWKEKLIALARWHKVPTPEFDKDKAVNIYVGFVTYREDNDRSRARLLHKIGYGSRLPIEDYAEYTAKFPDAPMPPVWLEGYQNKARKFGWWDLIGEMAEWRKPGQVQEDKTGRESVETGKPLVQVRSRVSTWELVSGGPLAGQDLAGGAVDEYRLGQEDIDWLLEHSGVTSRAPPEF